MDLTGQWHGTYYYADSFGPATPFLLDLTDKAGHLAGSMIEPETVIGSGSTVAAVIEGWRSGLSIDFTKTYRNSPQGYEWPVDYVGLVSDDGLTASGMWSLLELSGTFEMHRDQAIAPEVETEVGATVP